MEVPHLERLAAELQALRKAAGLSRGQLGALSTSQFLGLIAVAAATVALTVLARRRRSDP